MKVRTIAPAKVNWTLEVLGRRADGYHEVRTVLQTIDLLDEVTLEDADRLSLEVSGPHSAAEDDHTLQAARLLERTVGRELPVAIHVDKRVPVSAGLGGGSSDAAAVLRALRALYRLEVPDEDLAHLAASIGSDVPFFLTGGTALGSRRGDSIERLPDTQETWLVVLVPPISIAGKTRQMYSALETRDFSDGRRTAEVAALIRSGERVRDECLFNAFDRAAARVFDGLERSREALREASSGEPHMAGAGPALLSVQPTRKEAEAVASRLGTSHGRVFVARTLTAAEATRIQS